MRVTFCAYDSPTYVGGPNTWLRQLLPALRTRGIAPEVLLLSWGVGVGATARALRADGIPYRVAPAQLYTEDRIVWLLRQLRARPPAVFVPNLMVAAYYAGRWARAAGLPTVGVLHSDDAFHWGLVRQFVSGPPAYRLSSLVCVSALLEAEVSALQPAQMLVKRIPYGGITAPRLASSPDTYLRLAYAGRLVEQQKQISATTSALCQAARALPGVEALIYGDGPARPAVEAIIQREGAGLPIRLAGRVDSAQMGAELAQAHAIVLLSDYEGLPIVLLEAMSAGLVPICTAMRSGIPELVTDNESGLIVADRSASFVEAVRRLREEPGLWARLSAGARTRVEPYSQAATADSWAALLAQLGEQARLDPAPLARPGPISLPLVDPDLAREDRRRPPPTRRLIEQGRWLIARLVQRIHARKGKA